MRGVADQGDRPEGPLRDRVAVDQRVFVGMGAVLDQAGDIEPVEFPVLEPGQEFFKRRAVRL